MNRVSLNNERGAVLILVLLVLVAAIIAGVALTRSSVLDAKIAGNERRRVETLNQLESAAAHVFIVNTTALSSLATTTGKQVSYKKSDLPNACGNANVSITLQAVKKMIPGRGYDPGLRARYYVIDAMDEAGEQHLRVGTYKVFPPSGE